MKSRFPCDTMIEIEKTQIRRARPNEADLLTNLALESKGYWGYPEDFITACRKELTLTPDYLTDSRRSVFVAEIDEAILGLYALERLSAVEQELGLLFVAPGWIGAGIGRLLLAHARQRAAGMGARTILIQGDPHADGFYRRAGARHIGERESASIPGRRLPLYRLAINKGKPEGE